MAGKFSDMLSYYSLSSDPFAHDLEPSRLLRLPGIEDSLSSLGFFCERRGIGVLSGKSGAGKSCLLRLLVAGLPSGLFKPVYLCHSTVSVTEFYGHIAAALNLPVRGRRASLFRAIQTHAIHLHQSNKVHPIIIIDEAQNLSNDILIELRQLLNFQYDSETCMSVLLCGQDDLLQRLRLNVLEALANSITTTVVMKPLQMDETATYIEERIKHVGGQVDLFTQPALRAIHNTSRGIMRSINALASSAIQKAWRAKSLTVESDFITTITG